MNSAGRRKLRRKNKEETARLILWINSPPCFVPIYTNNKNEVIMDEEKIVAFGIRGARAKQEWKEFLIRRGVSPGVFKEKKCDHKENLLET